MENKNKLSTYIDTVWLALGEAVVTILISAVYLLIKRFDYTVLTGAALGSAVTVINFLILSIAVNRAVNGYIADRGDAEMDEEEADKYAKEHGMTVQNAMMKSYVLRMIIMIASLVIAMLSGHFNPLATVIPLLTYRPVLYAVEFVKTKIKAKRGE